MSDGLAKQWQSAFYTTLTTDAELADRLRAASLAFELATWTASLTTCVVRTFEALGWLAAAKGRRGNALPMSQQEYLGQDVMAFAAGPTGWRFPIAVAELENSATDERVAYSLWKTLCVTAKLRIVFCYRPEEGEARHLVGSLADEVIAPIPVDERACIHGTTLVTVGSRNEAATFPYGFFKSWKLNSNTGRFEHFPRG